MAALPGKTVALGNPPTSGHQVDKVELADWMTEYEALAGSGGLAYIDGSLSELQARSGTTDGEYGLVINTAAEAGVYEQISGSWVKKADIPSIFIESLAANEAKDARDRAQEWAENPEDTEVVPGEFSALHHAAKAEEHKTGAQAAETGAQTAQTAAETAESSAETARTQAELAADAAGRPIYDSVSEGLSATSDGEKFRVQTLPGMQYYRNDSGSETFLGWLGEVLFDDVDAVLADTGTYTEGTIIRTRKEDLGYEVAASGASDHHLVTDGGVKLYVKAGGSGLYSAGSFGASESATQSENEAAITAALNAFGQCSIPPGVTYDEDAIGASVGNMVLDGTNKRLRFGVNAFGPGSQASHITLRSVEDEGIAALYIMPAGYPAGSQPGALKIFWEDYDNLLGTGITAADYRDAGFTANQGDGHSGLGTVQINSQSGGNFSPFAPDIHVGFRNNNIKPLRILLPQIRALPAGSTFAGGLADFEPGKAIWRAGETYTAGKLILQGGGRIYEATNSGTAGGSRPVHATYQLTKLTVGSTSGFQVGEVVDTGAGGSFPRGTIYDIPDGTTLRLYQQNSVAFDTGFTVSDTLTGATSGASSTISATGPANIDIDFDPAGDPIQQFNSPAVAGREVSDGGITWRFLDDMSGGNSNNEAPGPLMLFGDEDSVPIYYERDLRFQFADYFLALLGGSGLKWVDPADSDKRWTDRITLGNRESLHSDGYGKTTFGAQQVERLTNMAHAYEAVAKTSGDTSMSANGVGFAKFNDAAATNFTGFTGGLDGQVIYVRFNTNNTTLVESANLELKGAGNITPAAKTGATFIRQAANKWTLVGGQ